ncbi:MAG TPA: HAMP domain-containing sensor histidine kinase [Methylomirabilota bacterium]|nr:HAMP domain-containing sensor histidine kinase [Methylomirabilota bacterium]
MTDVEGARGARVVWVATVALAAAGAVLQTVDPGPASPFRHLWTIPVLAAGVRFGVHGGALAAVAAAMAQTPALFVHIENAGLSAAAVDDLVSCLTLLAAGPLLGALAAEARLQRSRSALALAVPQALADEAPLPVALLRVKSLLERALAPAEIALVARVGGEEALAGGPRVATGSAVAAVLAGAAAVFIPSIAGGLRPRRALVVPLVAHGEIVGALAVERAGELPARERAAIEALGVPLALALENARLAARQRRSAEELAEKVAAATRHLEIADRAKSAFVAVASHELRSPLTALRGFSELLVLRAAAPGEVRRVAGIMQRETERLARIVEDLLDLSRLERGLAPQLDPRPLSAATAITSGVEVFRDGTHRVMVACAEPLPDVLADPDALDRVLKNLVSNAIKYSPPGTVVRVSARAAGGGVEIAVADQGRGIPADALPRLFEPYYRAPGSEGARGTGLGLAVVKALVEAHGGTVSVESAPGTGTRVAFTLRSLS